MVSGNNPTTGDTVYDNATGTTATGNGYYTVGSGSQYIRLLQNNRGSGVLLHVEYALRKINKFVYMYN